MLDKTRLPLGMPSITSLPISNLPADVIKVRVRWRVNDVARAFVKTPGKITKYALLVAADEKSLELYPVPDAVNTSTISTPRFTTHNPHSLC